MACEPAVILRCPPEGRKHLHEQRNYHGKSSIRRQSAVSFPLRCCCAELFIRVVFEISDIWIFRSCPLGVSPGLRLRPSLSDINWSDADDDSDSVAGASAPAFVERRSSRCACPGSRCVAGASAPAFVERIRTEGLSSANRVSPGLRLRPSLSGELRGRIHRSRCRCRRGFGPGLRWILARTVV